MTDKSRAMIFRTEGPHYQTIKRAALLKGVDPAAFVELAVAWACAEVFEDHADQLREELDEMKNQLRDGR